MDYIGPVISATLPSGLDEKEEATLMEEQRETDIAKVNIGHWCIMGKITVIQCYY